MSYCLGIFPSSEERIYLVLQGPVAQRPISANPELNFPPGFFLFCWKAFPEIINFPLFFLEHPIIKL